MKSNVKLESRRKYHEKMPKFKNVYKIRSIPGTKYKVTQKLFRILFWLMFKNKLFELLWFMAEYRSVFLTLWFVAQ